MDAPTPRLLTLLTRWLAPVYARGYVVAFSLLGAAILAGVVGFPQGAYFCFTVLVLAVGLSFAGTGLSGILFAFVLFRRRLSEGQKFSAYSGLAIVLLGGLFLLYCGLSAIWAFFSHWPFGYWPTANAPRP